jgi:hypothetical protein
MTLITTLVLISLMGDVATFALFVIAVAVFYEIWRRVGEE